MAAILNGFLPVRKRDHFAQERILNTRWGDAAISAPIHGGWSANPPSATQPEDSPDLDRDLPPTPPQQIHTQDGVFIVNHEEEQVDHEEQQEEAESDRDNITITIPLPWKKKNKQTSLARKASTNTTGSPRFGAPKRVDVMPSLATAEAAATTPLPESRITSPITRATATSPVLSFRSRLASPNLGDILSPVAEGFAKEGPSTRPTPVLSSLQFAQTIERSSSSSSTTSLAQRRRSLNAYNCEGIGASTMSSQGTYDERIPEMQRPPSRGIGATAHMRASSRGPRADSRGPRAPSVEPLTRRAPSVEPISRRAPSVEPVARRAASVEPMERFPDPASAEVMSIMGGGVLNMQPLRQRAPSIEPTRRRAPSIEPLQRRAPSIEPISRRAPSIEPVSRRAPSVEPIINRRAISREPRGRRGLSVEPKPRVRFHSEAPLRTHRPGSFSSNDGSGESDTDRDEPSEPESFFQSNRFQLDLTSSRRPRRRRSIASPITSPTAAAFGITEVISPPAYKTTFASVETRADLRDIRPIPPPPAQRNAPRNRSKSRTRGLYADMHDDFRLLARDVQVATANSAAPAFAPTPIIVQQLPTQSHVQSVLAQPAQRVPSPALTSNPPGSFAQSMASRMSPEPERAGYTSDSSLTGLPNIQSVSTSDSHGGKALLAALARERKDQLRREERERAREKIARKLERDRERVLSDNESTNGSVAGNEQTRRVYGGSIGSETEFAAIKGGLKGKTLVPDAEDIWG